MKVPNEMIDLVRAMTAREASSRPAAREVYRRLTRACQRAPGGPGAPGVPGWLSRPRKSSSAQRVHVWPVVGAAALVSLLAISLMLRLFSDRELQLPPRRMPVPPTRTETVPALSISPPSVVEKPAHAPVDLSVPKPGVPDDAKPSIVRLTEDAVDVSAGGLPAFKIETPTATYFLEKTGGGLSSLLDRDGNDWLGFHPAASSGAGGEYRGFPNAVHKQGGSYFHPRNAGTDPSTSRVEQVGHDRVSIVVESEGGQWAGRYEFFPTHCTFTMTRMPAERKYWVLYEGTPGGRFDLGDWWMTSAVTERQSMRQRHDADIPAPEWIAFGDANLERALLLVHHEDDHDPDTFYQMNRQMTVFGFGRQGLTKYLSHVPQRFSIVLLDTVKHDQLHRRAEMLIKPVR